MKNKVIPIFYCWILSLFILGCNASTNKTIYKDRSTHTWMIDTQAQWLQYREKSTHLEIKDGFASMNTIECSYKSTLMQFEHKRSAESIVFKQSDLWQNWQPIDNIGPENLRDAPVILSLGDGNVWLFGMYGGKGRKNKEKIEPDFKAEKIQIQGYEMPLWTTPFANQYDAAGGLKEKKGGYHAWHSKDMKTWIHHGAVTEKFSRWVTTAEYVDGKFYIYYDYPNDQDPHLYIDDDLTDGLPGLNKGLAFADPSDGSDCTFIRDKDGRFHVIYEDWSPINARKRSWDSPLAGHAISDDGIKDFKIVAPAIDNRTEATGEIATYKHPHWMQHPDFNTDIAQYNVHEPEQEAYGDWAAICIGKQYYLFGDFDPVGGHTMSVGWFTSPSLDKPFTWCDNIGKGHPDPDVCFHNGNFYLVTQQQIDYISPGPWVQEVSARVGVDTDNDGKINEWSNWQTVKESYDHLKGFAKHVSRSAAAIHLKALPPGYAFQFEFKMKDSTQNKSKPIMDKVSLIFEN